MIRRKLFSTDRSDAHQHFTIVPSRHRSTLLVRLLTLMIGLSMMFVLVSVRHSSFGRPSRFVVNISSSSSSALAASGLAEFRCPYPAVHIPGSVRRRAMYSSFVPSDSRSSMYPA